MFIIFLSFFNSKDVLVFFFFFRFWKSGRLVPSRFDEQFYNNRTRTNIRQKRNAQIYSDFLSNFFNAIALTFLSFFLFVSFSFVMKEPIRVEGHKKFGSWGVNFFLILTYLLNNNLENAILYSFFPLLCCCFYR